MKYVELDTALAECEVVRGKFPAASVAVAALKLRLAEAAIDLPHPNYGVGQTCMPPGQPSTTKDDDRKDQAATP